MHDNGNNKPVYVKIQVDKLHVTVVNSLFTHIWINQLSCIFKYKRSNGRCSIDMKLTTIYMYNLNKCKCV